jgi:aspartyl-tRNA(Asn)/glutamyl-tRNA(Gln) amidotransferase subunit C
MAIDDAAVDHVARLARLALSEEERRRMSRELASILEYANAIQALDLDEVEPTSHSLPLTNAVRPDEVAPSLSAQAALKGAPQEEDGRFRVPRILEDE